jgi:hypothetical protein
MARPLHAKILLPLYPRRHSDRTMRVDMENLVPGRACANCTVCCTIPTIDKPELQKRAGATCRHCSKGCEIYETRPSVCRTFFCGWRQLEIFGEDWRPDKCGAYAELETDIPEHLQSPSASA